MSSSLTEAQTQQPQLQPITFQRQDSDTEPDTKLIVFDQEFYVHFAIIKQHSPWFEASVRWHVMKNPPSEKLESLDLKEPTKGEASAAPPQVLDSSRKRSSLSVPSHLRHIYTAVVDEDGTWSLWPQQEVR